ncbi:4'-phosphopantetheinyl transferase superfamily protein [Microbispora sp. ZYX-F-249]|uniref:4'-phosphopantetheinyl transferase superfamily protein n=1 Tax=Microbispora maris TaxID=3144104 RepID=A0ABV0AXA4_9ACTN
MVVSVLRTGECHVWWADPRHETIDTLTEPLSVAELERAARFRRDQDRRRFLTGARLLRLAAGARLGISPGNVVVDRTCPDCDKHHGRPSIRAGGTVLHASVSHSGDRVAVALTSEAPLGVDVEELVPAGSVEDLVQCALTPRERDVVLALPEHEQYEAFVRIWVCKEAALKATGHGLRISPDLVEFDLTGDPPTLLRWPLDIPPETVRIHRLDPGPGYLGVVALLTGDRDVEVVETRQVRREQLSVVPLPAAA